MYRIYMNLKVEGGIEEFNTRNRLLSRTYKQLRQINNKDAKTVIESK